MAFKEKAEVKEPYGVSDMEASPPPSKALLTSKNKV